MFTKRLTFQLASPVSSDSFDLLAKTTFSLARHRHLFYGINSPRLTSFLTLDSHRTALKTWEVAPLKKKLLSFKIPIHDSHN